MMLRSIALMITHSDIVREAGVEVIVAGSAVFKAADRKEAVEAIKG